MGSGTLLGALFAGLFAQRVRRGADNHLPLHDGLWRGDCTDGSDGERTYFCTSRSPCLESLSSCPEVIFSSFLQRLVPAEMRGRVFGFISLLAMALNPLGLLLAGVLGDSIGPRAGLWIGGGSIAV